MIWQFLKSAARICTICILFAFLLICLYFSLMCICYRFEELSQFDFPWYYRWFKNAIVFGCVLLGNGIVLAICTTLTLYVLYEDEDQKINDGRFLRTYSAKLSNGFLKETPSQTQSDMLVSIHGKGGRENLTSVNNKYNQYLPNWYTATSHNSTSSMPLQFSSFHFDSSGIVQSFDQFEMTQPLERTFEDLAGIDELKNSLFQFAIVPFAEADSARKTGMNTWKPDIPRGILLMGEQGSGKSSIVDACIGEIREIMQIEVRYFKVHCPNCFGSSIGGDVSFRDIFHFAVENGPSVILFENIEFLYDRSVTILISELRELIPGKLLVFATTSKPERLHEKLLRAGNFDFSYELPELDNWAREAVLGLHFKKRNCSIKRDILQSLAHITRDFNCGDLEKIVSMVNQSTWKAQPSSEIIRMKEVKEEKWISPSQINSALDKYSKQKRRASKTLQKVIASTEVVRR